MVLEAIIFVIVAVVIVVTVSMIIVVIVVTVVSVSVVLVVVMVVVSVVVVGLLTRVLVMVNGYSPDVIQPNVLEKTFQTVQGDGSILSVSTKKRKVKDGGFFPTSEGSGLTC